MRVWRSGRARSDVKFDSVERSDSSGYPAALGVRRLIELPPSRARCRNDFAGSAPVDDNFRSIRLSRRGIQPTGAAAQSQLRHTAGYGQRNSGVAATHSSPKEISHDRHPALLSSGGSSSSTAVPPNYLRDHDTCEFKPGANYSGLRHRWEGPRRAASDSERNFAFSSRPGENPPFRKRRQGNDAAKQQTQEDRRFDLACSLDEEWPSLGPEVTRLPTKHSPLAPFKKTLLRSRKARQGDFAGYDQKSVAECPADDSGENSLYECFCSECGLLRSIPYHPGSETFSCAAVGLQCGTGCAVGIDRSVIDDDDDWVDEALVENMCEVCGAVRVLPYPYGARFSCKSVGLTCGVGVTSSVREEVPDRAETARSLAQVTPEEEQPRRRRRRGRGRGGRQVARDRRAQELNALAYEGVSELEPDHEGGDMGCDVDGEEETCPDEICATDANFDHHAVDTSMKHVSHSVIVENSETVENATRPENPSEQFSPDVSDCELQSGFVSRRNEPIMEDENERARSEVGLQNEDWSESQADISSHESKVTVTEEEESYESDDVLDDDVDADNDELFALVCTGCGAVRALPFEADDGFVCTDVGLSCVADAPKGTSAANDGANAVDRIPGEDVYVRESDREKLLWKVLIYNMPANEAAALFRQSGFDAPSTEELQKLRDNTLAGFRKKTRGTRDAALAALKSSRKKGPVKRFLNNELVTVGKKEKYLKDEKESVEDKAKTSVELYILGIGRGGRHAVKIARDEKKKGPKSHK